MEINSSFPEPVKIDLISFSGETTIFKVVVDGFRMNKVHTQGGEAFIISVDEATPLLIKDCPDLPKVTSSLIIDKNSKMQAEVVSSSYKEFTDIEIAPSKGNLLRTVDPASVPYVYGKVYNINSFFPGDLVDLREPYFIRDYRGQTVVIYPFQYNPVSKVLRVYSELTIKVSNADKNAKALSNPVTAPSKIDNEFEKIYESHFLNFNKASKYTPVGEQGNMLVISHGPFMAEMQEFVNWKNTIGIPTEIVDVSTIGGTAAIKSYVSNYYNTQGLTFLLLVGDAAQVPSSSTSAGDSDNDYGYVVGNDHYPDLFVGRFSAEQISHVKTQVDRTIDYELNPLVFPEWYNKGIGIASSQGPGDDNEMDYEHVRNMQTDLLAFTYTNCPELFDGSQGGLDAPGNPTPAMVAAEVNAGSGVILYTGHGSTTSWGTSGFNNGDVNNLTNLRKLPFIWSVACVNGNFVNNTCFGEAWLRATDNGEPTGAIGALMSTISQSWNPPMSGQDEMVDIMVESYANNIKRTFGGISMNGCMQMNDDYGSAGESMTDTWNCFGDPSLVVRTDTPKVISATHNNTVFIGATQFQVNCNVDDAYVCLTVDHQIIGTGYVTGGIANINFNPLLTLDTLTVAITAFNYIPYLADVPIIPASGPYVIYNGHQLNDNSGNANGMADYGETVMLDLEVKNVGIAQANNIEVKLTSNDPYITMTDTSEYYGNIMPDSTLLISSAFAFDVMDSIPDKHKVLFEFSATGGTNAWSGGFIIEIHAPVLEYYDHTVSDISGNNNGKFDPGEMVDITITVDNNGSSEAYNVKGILSNNDPYVTINSTGFLSYGNIPPSGTAQQTFSVSASPTTPAGHQTYFQLSVESDSGYYCIDSFSIIIGQIPICIIDLDGNNNSAPAMQTAIQNLGLTYDYFTSFPPDLNLYSSLFLCLGIYWNNHILDAAEGQLLMDYLNNGGCLYMEGGDTWYYDQQTAVHPMFSINPVADGSSDLGMLLGEVNTFTDGMSFNYSGDNSYIDHIDEVTPAFKIFNNQSPNYGSGVAYDQGTYKTIAASHEFGGLDDSAFPSTKEELMAQYLEFFGLYTTDVNAAFIGVPTKINPGDTVDFYDMSTGNNFMWFWNFQGGTPQYSSQQNPSVIYNSTGTYDVELIVSDGIFLDTLIKYDYIEVGCVNPFTLVTTATPSTINPGDTSQLNVIPAGGNGTYTYSWISLPAGFYSTHPDPLVNPLTTTMYIVTVNDAYCSATDTVTVFVNGGSNTLFGHLSYNNNNHTAIDNTKLVLETLSGFKMDSVFTDIAGNYSLNNLIDENYVLRMHCDKAWGGVNASDALAIMRHFVGMNIITGLKLIAADVDGSSFINTTDALMCVQRFVGIINSFPVGDWAESGDTLEVYGGSMIQYNPQALCYGDVDASYIPPVGKISPSIIIESEEIIYVNEYSLIELPVFVEKSVEIGAISLLIDYPEEYLEFRGIGFDHSLNMPPLFNEDNGVIRFGWYCLNAASFEKGDELIRLVFHPQNTYSWPPEGIEIELLPGSKLANSKAFPIEQVDLKSKRLCIAKDDDDDTIINLSNYPNPFKTNTIISYSLPEPAYVDIKLYNVYGELIRVISRNEYYEEGTAKVLVERGELNPGVYMYKFLACGVNSFYSASQMMIVQ